MDPTRRKILKTGAAATVVAAAPGVFAQQAAPSGTGKFYAKGPVRIHYQESGSGFPLMLIAGGGLNSTIAGPEEPFRRDRGVQERVPLHRSRPAQRLQRPVDRPARGRPALGLVTPTTTSA